MVFNSRYGVSMFFLNICNCSSKYALRQESRFVDVLQIGIDRTGTWAVDGFCASTKSIKLCPQISVFFWVSESQSCTWFPSPSSRNIGIFLYCEVNCLQTTNPTCCAIPSLSMLDIWYNYLILVFLPYLHPKQVWGRSLRKELTEETQSGASLKVLHAPAVCKPTVRRHIALLYTDKLFYYLNYFEIKRI